MLRPHPQPPFGMLVAAILAALAFTPVVRGITAELVHETGVLLPPKASADPVRSVAHPAPTR